MAKEPEARPVSPEERVVIGEIVAPFGHRGEVKVYPHTDFPERLVAMKEVTLRSSTGLETVFAVERARLHKNVVVMKLHDVPTMTDAEGLRGLEIVIPPQPRRPLTEPDTWYVDDLIGLRVLTVDGRHLGVIQSVLKTPANDVYDLGTLLIPAIRDVIARVDLDEGVMEIRPIPGLLDDVETA